ncbi:MAG: type I restriction enzyme HsdR N-terminal domain-containing protein [Coriobacteriia bacterium]
MAVYQDKALERVSKGLRKYRSVAQKSRSNGAQESDTRMIVSSIISEVLGWDAFDNLTGEYRVKGNYIDFVMRKDGKNFLIIEVKAITTRLNAKHLYQAVSYAANEGVEWVLLTNGAEWQLYRVLFQKPVDQVLVFEIDITSDEVKPKERASLFYLLTPEAQRKDELEAYYQRTRALAAPNIARLILTEPVLTKLRSEIKNDSGYRIALDELSDLLVGCIIRAEVNTDAVSKQHQKIKRAAKGTSKQSRQVCEGILAEVAASAIEN